MGKDDRQPTFDIGDETNAALFIAASEAGRKSHRQVELADLLVGLAFTPCVRRLVSGVARPGALVTLPAEDILRLVTGASEPDIDDEDEAVEALLNPSQWTIGISQSPMLPLSREVTNLLGEALAQCRERGASLAPKDLLIAFLAVGSEELSPATRFVFGATFSEMRHAIESIPCDRDTGLLPL